MNTAPFMKHLNAELLITTSFLRTFSVITLCFKISIMSLNPTGRKCVIFSTFIAIFFYSVLTSCHSKLPDSQMMLVLSVSVSAGLVGSGAARAEPLRHTLVRQGSPKTKTGGHHVRSKTPNRGLSPPTEGGKSPRAPTSGKRDNCLSSITSLYGTSFMTYTFCVEFH